MSEMTEAERLVERLEALLAGATPGPWEVYKHPIAKIENALEELTYQVVHTDPLADHLFLLNASGKCPATTGCGPTSEANAALIVEAVNALPTLTALIRSQAAEIEKLRSASIRSGPIVVTFNRALNATQTARLTQIAQELAAEEKEPKE